MKRTIIQKIAYLEDNLGYILTQQNIDAIDGIGKMYKKFKKISSGQEEYLDALIIQVDKEIKKDD